MTIDAVMRQLVAEEVARLLDERLAKLGATSTKPIRLIRPIACTWCGARFGESCKTRRPRQRPAGSRTEAHCARQRTPRENKTHGGQ